MEYTIPNSKLVMPEYGRGVQEMVDYCLTLADRDERTRCAHTIVKVMGDLNPDLRDTPDYRHKLWDHLAIMADFGLDIDYPFGTPDRDMLITKNPERVPYMQGKVEQHHYGRIAQDMLQVVLNAEPGSELQKKLACELADVMKRNYLIWNKDQVSDQHIVDDLYNLSRGRVDLPLEEWKSVNAASILLIKQELQQQLQGSKKKKKKNKNNNGIL